MRLQCIDVTKNHLVYAGFFSRLGAFVIDIIVVMAGLLPIRLIYAFLAYVTDFEPMTMELLFHYTAIDIFSYVVISAYFVLMTYYSGRTLGKMATSIYVVSVRGGKKSFLDILYRETIGRYLSSLLYIGYLIAVFHPQKAALHDRICQTRVVESVTAVLVQKEEAVKEKSKEHAETGSFTELRTDNTMIESADLPASDIEYNSDAEGETAVNTDEQMCP